MSDTARFTEGCRAGSWQAALQQFVDWIVAEIPRTATVTEVRKGCEDRATIVIRFGDDGPTT